MKLNRKLVLILSAAHGKGRFRFHCRERLFCHNPVEISRYNKRYLSAVQLPNPAYCVTIMTTVFGACHAL